MTLRAQLQRGPLLGFFALTFAWSWACWALSPAIRPQLPLPTEASDRADAFVVATLVVLAFVALLTSGPIAGRATSGGPGFADAKP